MKLEDQVCSLELSRKLKELGIEQKSIFVWEYFDDKCYGVKFIPYVVVQFIPYAVVPHESNNCELYAAFTASELISILPHRITLKEDEPFNSFTLYINKSLIVKNSINLLDRDKHPNPVSLEEIKYTSSYHINYECDSTGCTGENAWLRRQLFDHNIWDKNFSNALAKTLIYLIENKMICITN